LSANGKDHIVKLVTKGELLGQRSMISDEPVNLSAVALEDMQVCFIPKSEVIHKKQSVFDECDEKYLWRSKRSR
jgi:signal-transduction protein with cAMP-binding, CBS, and nucleotidyltransferase domain